MGAIQQAQAQAQLDAQREANRLAAFEPVERLARFGSGIAQLISGYPAAGTTITSVSKSNTITNSSWYRYNTSRYLRRYIKGSL